MHQISSPILEKYFSKPRLEKYRYLANKKYDFIKLYQLNSIYSEKFFTGLSQFEVIFRNTINQQLIETLSWINNDIAIWLKEEINFDKIHDLRKK